MSSYESGGRTQEQSAAVQYAPDNRSIPLIPSTAGSIRQRSGRCGRYWAAGRLLCTDVHDHVRIGKTGPTCCFGMDGGRWKLEGREKGSAEEGRGRAGRPSRGGVASGREVWDVPGSEVQLVMLPVHSVSALKCAIGTAV